MRGDHMYMWVDHMKAVPYKERGTIHNTYMWGI